MSRDEIWQHQEVNYWWINIKQFIYSQVLDNYKENACIAHHSIRPIQKIKRMSKLLEEIIFGASGERTLAEQICRAMERKISMESDWFFEGNFDFFQHELTNDSFRIKRPLPFVFSGPIKNQSPLLFLPSLLNLSNCNE